VKIAQRVKARYAAAVAKLSPEWDGVISTLEQRVSDNLKISCGDCIVTVSFADWEGTPTILVECPSAATGAMATNWRLSRKPVFGGGRSLKNYSPTLGSRLLCLKRYVAQAVHQQSLLSEQISPHQVASSLDFVDPQL